MPGPVALERRLPVGYQGLSGDGRYAALLAEFHHHRRPAEDDRSLRRVQVTAEKVIRVFGLGWMCRWSGAGRGRTETKTARAGLGY